MTQMVIMLSTGRWSYTQMLSLCISVMSLSWGASRQFADISDDSCLLPQVLPDSKTKRQIRPRPEAVDGAPTHLAVDACRDFGQHLPPRSDRGTHRRLHISRPSSLLCPQLFGTLVFLQEGQMQN